MCSNICFPTQMCISFFILGRLWNDILNYLRCHETEACLFSFLFFHFFFHNLIQTNNLKCISNENFSFIQKIMQFSNLSSFTCKSRSIHNVTIACKICCSVQQHCVAVMTTLFTYQLAYLVLYDEVSYL